MAEGTEAQAEGHRPPGRAKVRCVFSGQHLLGENRVAHAVNSFREAIWPSSLRAEDGEFQAIKLRKIVSVFMADLFESAENLRSKPLDPKVLGEPDGSTRNYTGRGYSQ